MKSTNFEFLREKWPELASLGGFAEQYVWPDPASAIPDRAMVPVKFLELKNIY